MADFDLAEIVDEMAGGNPVTVIEPGSPEAGRVPSRWRQVAKSTEAATRCSAALDLWNRDFLDMVPRLAEVFRERLVDVRVCVLRDDWVLLYIARDTVEPQLTWIGWDPDAFGNAKPPFWDTLPAPAREFLTGVHAGFTGSDWESFGLIPPAHMRTFAEWAEFNDDAIAAWDKDAEIASTRMVVVTTNCGALNYCASPDIPPGKIALVYEGDIDYEQDFGSALDQLMSERFAP